MVSEKLQQSKDKLMDQYTDKFLSELYKLRDIVVGDDIDVDVDAVVDSVFDWNLDIQVPDLSSKTWFFKQLAVDTLIWQTTIFDELFSSKEDIAKKQQEFRKQIKDYLTNEWFWDMVQDKIINTKKFQLYLSSYGVDGEKLFANLQKARKLFVSAKTVEDLDHLKKELNLYNEDVDVSDDDFLQDDLEYTETVDIGDKEQVLFDSIESKPYDWNRDTWVTWCSYTARLNAESFGVRVPSGNAFVAKEKDPIDDAFIDSISNKQDEKLSLDEVNRMPSTANFADVFVYSQWKYAKFGHRCAMFKNGTTNEWFVLDPYRQPNPASKNFPNNPASIKPKPLEEYMKHNNTIAQLNFYNAPIAVVDQIEQTA